MKLLSPACFLNLQLPPKGTLLREAQQIWNISSHNNEGFQLSRKIYDRRSLSTEFTTEPNGATQQIHEKIDWFMKKISLKKQIEVNAVWLHRTQWCFFNGAKNWIPFPCKKIQNNNSFVEKSKKNVADDLVSTGSIVELFMILRLKNVELFWIR